MRGRRRLRGARWRGGSLVVAMLYLPAARGSATELCGGSGAWAGGDHGGLGVGLGWVSGGGSLG